MNKQEKEKIIEMVQMGGGCGATEPWAKGYDEGVNACLDTLEDIETEEVELPKVVAKIIENAGGIDKSNKEYVIRSVIDDYYKGNWESCVQEWFDTKGNLLKFYQAVENGYKEKEPLYIMPVPYAEGMYYYKNEDGKITACFDSDRYMMFTAAEIDEYFPKIKEFAEEVEQ